MVCDSKEKRGELLIVELAVPFPDFGDPEEKPGVLPTAVVAVLFPDHGVGGAGEPK